MEGRFRFLTFASLNKRLAVAVSNAMDQLLRPRAACLLLVLFGFAVHLPALHGPYIWEDQTLIALAQILAAQGETSEAESLLRAGTEAADRLNIACG